MIEISHVDKWYGPSFQALKDCTTRVAKGEVVVVCGPSGSGWDAGASLMILEVF